MKKALSLGLISLLLLVAQLASAEPIWVYVSILPQKYFVKKIGADLVEVSVMVEPGASPATYEPKPKQMVGLTKAKIYYAIGVPFENAWLDKIAATNPEMIIVHTEAGIEKMVMISHGRHAEGEHQQRKHHNVIKDPHVWLSPPLVMQQARNIFDGLVATDPVHRSIYETNYKKFIMELVDLDLELKRSFAGRDEQIEVMVFHPSWGYFARAYGLEQIPIEVEGKEPKPAELKNLIDYAKKRGIKVIFVQPQFSRQAAQTIARSIGGQIVFLDPLALDWPDNLREAANKFKADLR
jgi:zinc transport system substrate-binding protein